MKDNRLEEEIEETHYRARLGNVRKVHSFPEISQLSPDIYQPTCCLFFHYYYDCPPPSTFG